MSSNVKSSVAKSNALMSKKHVNVFKQQSPVTMAEKFIHLEKRFQTIQVEFDQLKNDHGVYKDKLSEAQQEISDWKKVTDGLRAEVCELKKKLEPVPICVEKTVKETSVPSSCDTLLLRTIYHKLPCKSKIEFDQLKVDLIDLRLFIYMVSIK